MEGSWWKDSDPPWNGDNNSSVDTELFNLFLGNTGSAAETPTPPISIPRLSTPLSIPDPFVHSAPNPYRSGTEPDLLFGIGSSSIPDPPMTRKSSSEYNSVGATEFMSSVGNAYDEGLDAAAKVRLARKAELARESRRKKKKYIDELEATVSQLKQTLEGLRNKQSRSEEKRRTMAYARTEEDRRKNQKQLLGKLEQFVDGPTVSRDELDSLGVMIKMFVDNSRERQAQVDYNLDCVEECIMPTQPVKFTLWGLDQRDEFYDNPGLWTSLMQGELGLSDEQLEALRSKRSIVHEQRKELVNAEMKVRELRELAERHLDGLDSHTDKILGILEPIQQAQYCLWVERNDWAMQMLDSL